MNWLEKDAINDAREWTQEELRARAAEMMIPFDADEIVPQEMKLLCWSSPSGAVLIRGAQSVWYERMRDKELQING